jgi:hypothetical protein
MLELLNNENQGKKNMKLNLCSYFLFVFHYNK